jgi:hypothetical protein
MSQLEEAVARLIALLVAGGIGFALALLLTRPPSWSRYLR